MSERRYKPGVDRRGQELLPVCLDEWVSEDNPVRAIDAYVDSLDLSALGFRYAAGPLSAGQPAYAPAHLLKLYLYGSLNRIRSSRRLEAEAGRNLEVVWLLEGRRPRYRTIAEFRRHNSEALQAANRDSPIRPHRAPLRRAPAVRRRRRAAPARPLRAPASA